MQHHPLMEDTKGLKDSELESKIQELSRKYFQAARNPALQYQVWVLLENYKTELATRRSKMWEELNQKRDTDLDNLINIS